MIAFLMFQVFYIYRMSQTLNGVELAKRDLAHIIKYCITFILL